MKLSSVNIMMVSIKRGVVTDTTKKRICKTPGCENEARPGRTKCSTCAGRATRHNNLQQYNENINQKWYLPIVGPLKKELNFRVFQRKDRTKYGILIEMSIESGIPIATLKRYLKLEV